MTEKNPDKWEMYDSQIRKTKLFGKSIFPLDGNPIFSMPPDYKCPAENDEEFQRYSDDLKHRVRQAFWAFEQWKKYEKKMQKRLKTCILLGLIIGFQIIAMNIYILSKSTFTAMTIINIANILIAGFLIFRLLKLLKYSKKVSESSRKVEEDLKKYL